MLHGTGYRQPAAAVARLRAGACADAKRVEEAVEHVSEGIVVVGGVEGVARGLSEEGSLAAVDFDDGAAAQEPGWIGAGGEDFEATAVLAL